MDRNWSPYSEGKCRKCASGINWTNHTTLHCKANMRGDTPCSCAIIVYCEQFEAAQSGSGEGEDA